jgi:hypothetical protein
MMRLEPRAEVVDNQPEPRCLSFDEVLELAGLNE